MYDSVRKGIVLLDKPGNLTSMECVERIKEMFGASKAGHSGTLDPAVTGVLLIALNEATKAMPVLIGLKKEYDGTMHIHGDVDDERAMRKVRDFQGKITQIPPVRSAVSRKPREREIYSFDITKISGRELRFRVACESGTYVRKLCHDFGEALGVGAHMTKLRRTRISDFSDRECVSLRELKKKDIIPLERVLERTGLKKVIVKKESLGRIRNGMPVRSESILKAAALADGECVGIYDEWGGIVALGSVRDSSGPVINTDRVFK
jgi:H/ACA ribonucleoprotein complex subunit 4